MERPNFEPKLGEQLDIFLIRAAVLMVVIVATALSAKFVLPAWWLLRMLLGVMAIVVGWRASSYVVARAHSRWKVGDALDGLWLPARPRITCWSWVVCSLLICLLTLLITGPPDAAELAKQNFSRLGSQAQQRLNNSPPTTQSLTSRTNDGLDIDAAKPLDEDHATKGKHGTSIIDDAALNNPGGGKQVVVAWLPPDINTQTLTEKRINTLREERQKGNFTIGNYLLPFGLVSGMLGWGSDTEYREQSLQSINSTMSGQVLSKENLAALVQKVPAEGRAAWRESYMELLDQAVMPPGRLTSDQKTEFIQNIDAAMKGVASGEFANLNPQMQTVLLKIDERIAAGDNADQVAATVSSLLSGHYPGEKFRDALKGQFISRVGSASFAKYWPALEKIPAGAPTTTPTIAPA